MNEYIELITTIVFILGAILGRTSGIPKLNQALKAIELAQKIKDAMMAGVQKGTKGSNRRVKDTISREAGDRGIEAEMQNEVDIFKKRK